LGGNYPRKERDYTEEEISGEGTDITAGDNDSIPDDTETPDEP
jgi:hypothetical protein